MPKEAFKDQRRPGKKLITHLERLASKPKCRTCRKLHEVQGKAVDCIKCVPPLWPENKIPFQVWQMCRRQLIMGFGGPVDLNFQSVFGYMDRIGIPIEAQEYIFNLVYGVYNHFEVIRAEKEKK